MTDGKHAASSDRTAINAAGLAALAGHRGHDGHGGRRCSDAARRNDLKLIDTVVVIYAENRSFDNLYGVFPGRQRPAEASRRPAMRQLDRDGTPAHGAAAGLGRPDRQGRDAGRDPGADRASAQPAVRDRRPAGLQRAARRRSRTISGIASIRTRCRSTAARTTSSSPGPIPAAWSWAIMTAPKLPMWTVAQHYALADNFFMGAFGGSFLNHHLADLRLRADLSGCRQEPGQADDRGRRAGRRHAEGRPTTRPTRRSTASPKFVNDGNHHARLLRRQHDAAALPAERQQAGPGRRPGLRRPDEADHAAAADRADDRRSAERQGRQLGLVCRRLAGGARRQERRRRCRTSSIHHQPFNYFAALRARHAGARRASAATAASDGAEFIKAIDDGNLPQVTFYKPQGNLNEHAGYADVTSRRPAHRRRRRASGEEPAMARTCWSSSPMTRTAASGTMSRRPRATAGARARASRRSSSRPMPRRASSTTRIRHDLDPALHHPALRSADAAGHRGPRQCGGVHQQAPLGDLTSALDLRR